MMTDTGSKSKESPDVMKNGNVQEEIDDLPDLVVEKLPKDVSDAKKRGRPKKGTTSLGKSRGRPKIEYDDLPDLESDGENDMIVDNSVNDEQNVDKHSVVKQRGRPKKKATTSDVEKDDSDEATRSVKPRGRPKKSYKIPEGSDDELIIVQETAPITPKSRGRPKKISAPDDVEEPTETIVKQKGRPKKVATEATISDEKDVINEDIHEKVTTVKGSPKKELKSEKDFEEDPPVAKHRGRPKKGQANLKDASDHEEEDMVVDERSRKHIRSRGRPKKVLEPEEDVDEFDNDEDEDEEDEPSIKMARGKPDDDDYKPNKESTGTKQRGRPKKVSENNDVDEKNEINDDVYVPKARGRPKKSHHKKHQAVSTSKRGRPKGKARKRADTWSDSDDEDDSNVRKSGRNKSNSRDERPSRAATMKVKYADESDIDSEENDDGDSGEDWTADSRGKNVLDVKKKWHSPFTTKHRKPFSSVSSEEEDEYAYMPRLSKKRAASMDASESSSPVHSPKKEKVEKTHRSRCSLGAKCTMKGPKHFHKSCHPGDDSYGEESHSDGEVSGSAGNGNESDSIDQTTPDPNRKETVADGDR